MTPPTESSRCRLFSRLSLLLALGLLPILAGCVVAAAGVAAGAGAIAYVSGELETSLDHDMNQVAEATRSALKQLEFTKVSEKKDAIDAEFVYRSALDKKITVKLGRVTDKTTKIKIRVDILGDKALSLSILDKIKVSL